MKTFTNPVEAASAFAVFFGTLLPVVTSKSYCGYLYSIVKIVFKERKFDFTIEINLSASYKCPDV